MSGILDILRPQLNQIGKAGVNALFPNDFEYYAITLELTDSKGKTVDYLTFPVTPSMIGFDDKKVVNIKKTMGGVTSLDTDTEIPKFITMSGMFGRKLRLLISPPIENSQSTANGIFSSVSGNGLQINSPVLNAKLKTGYGATKVLEAIIKKSSSLDQYNRPNRLYLYIPPLGHNFLVKATQFRLDQDYQSSNMLWKYTLAFTTLARIEDLKIENDNQDNSLIKSTSIDILQRTANSVVRDLKQSVF